MSTRYSAPLPFRGQKRNFASRLRQALDPLNGISLIVDCFGGSGLLSRVAKDAIPQATVIYNDFDAFRKRLENIPETEKLRQLMMELLGDQYLRGQRISEADKECIIAHLKQHPDADYLTISSWLLFSGKWATSLDGLTRNAWYYKMRRTPIDATGYLDGIDVVSEDYQTLILRYPPNQHTLYLLDPPYLDTDLDGYEGDDWTASDQARLISALEDMPHFVFFASSKSAPQKMPDGTVLLTHDTAVSARTHGYTDLMFLHL